MTSGVLQRIAALLGGDAARSMNSLPSGLVVQSGDGAIDPLVSAIYLITKGSAAAITIAAPGAAGIGVVITFLTGTDFAHVVTFTGTTLQDGTAGANSTWTATAVQGCALTVIGVTATKWNVVNFNLGTIAP